MSDETPEAVLRQSPVYTPGVVWHAVHARPACPLVSGNVAVCWKLAPCHCMVLV